MIVCSQGYLNLIDVTVERNAYGSQLESFEAELELRITNSKLRMIEGIFIRAPKFKSIGKSIEVLATHADEPVLVRSGNVMVGSFHPELTDDDMVYRLFLGSISKIN
ncbi:pyridoxal 5'-phosphate synthase glutaminase subunit PdxT [Candidatus Peregrinibacteria bacterium]|nr:MAG: pyridoxal 5'-phosphate synthase glutaminase subunit PdxT [Candidatus Peregrinibacteria bacterium]